MTRIGLISDTHGLLRPEALDFLAGSDHILHAGDICGPEVLDRLRDIAPVTAVRGNNDRGEWALALQEIEAVDWDGVRILMIHDLGELPRDRLRDGVRVVVSGHSHKPVVQERDGVVFVNPGSPGPRRFKLPISVGELLIGAGKVEARTVALG